MSDPRETPVDWEVQPPSRMSVTLGQKADNCPRDAGLYLRYRGQASSGPLLRGSLGHLFYQRMMEQLMIQGEASLVAAQPDEDPLKAAAEVSQVTKQWVDDLVEETGWPLSEAEIDEVRVMAYHMAIGNDIDPATVIALEQTLVLDLPGGGEMIGRVDVAAIGADGVLDVGDLKTSYYTGSEAEVQDNVQAPWYAAMLLWGRPLDPETGELGEPLGIDAYVQWVRCRQIFPRFINPSTGLMTSRGGDRLWTPVELRDKVAAAARAWRRVRRGVDERVWPAKSGDHCSYCTAPAECPIPSQLRRFAGTIHTVEQASESKEWAVRQGELVRATNAEVAAFAKAQGLEFLEVGADRYGFVVSHATSVKRKGRGTDWDGLRDAVASATEFGEPFDVNDWLVSRPQSSFKKIKREEQ